MAANPAASGDRSSGSLRSGTAQSASTVDIYQEIRHSLDLLIERALVMETITQESAKVLPRFAAVEQRAKAHFEASSCTPAQDGPHRAPPQLEKEAFNDLSEKTARRTTPMSTFSTGGGLTDMQVPEKSQDENADGTRPLLHNDQTSTVPQSANPVNIRSNHYEEIENTTSGESSTNYLSAENLRDQLNRSISAHIREEKGLQTRRMAVHDHTRSQLTNSDILIGQIESLESRSPSSNMICWKRKRPACQHEQEDEPLERIAETFGMESDLEYFEHIVDDAKANAQWTSGAWTPRTLLLTPDVDPLQLVQALPTLVKELNDNDFAERLLEVKQRMALAHSYSAYRSAHANHEIFLRWKDRLGNSGVNLTPCDGRRTDSIVKQRFIGIDVWQCQRDRKQAAVKINNWQRCGRPWADMIDRLGYSSLLLVPPSITNKR